MKLPQETPLVYNSLTKAQFDSEIEKGMADIREGKVYTVADVNLKTQ